MSIKRDGCQLDGLNDGVHRFLSDEQRSRMRTRCWVFLDEEDDVVSLVQPPRRCMIHLPEPPDL